MNNFIMFFIFLIGVFFLVIAYRNWHSSDKIVKNGVKTEGVIIKLVERVDRHKGEMGTKAPAVQFKTQKGEVITYYSTTYTSFSSFQEGQVVPIWYMPDNPQVATLKGTDTYLLPMVFAGFGILAVLIGWQGFVEFLTGLMHQ